MSEGNTSAVNTVFTTKRAGPKGSEEEATADIFAEANDGRAKATLTITQ